MNKDIQRIAIIIDTLNSGGAEKVCLILTKALKTCGIDTHLIVLKRKCSYELTDDSTVHFIHDDAKTKLYQRSVQLNTAKKLNSLIQKLGGFDAYFSNLDECHAIVAKTSLPNCFYVVHNSIENSLAAQRRFGPRKYNRKLEAIQSLNGKRLISVSKGIKQEIEQGTLIQPESITCIYNPIDIDAIQTQAKEPTENLPSRPYIIYAGRVAAQKRLDVLIQAFQTIKADVDLLILSNNAKKLKKIISKYNTANKTIICHDFKQNPYPWIKNAQALVLSSDFEGLGMVLIEALSCQTPVVSTDCPHGPSEILSNELSQFLTPVGEPKALGKAIDAAINTTIEHPPILDKVSLKKVAAEYIEAAKQPNTRKPLNITFYLPNCDDIEKLDTLDPYLSWKEMPRGEGFWILQTYCLLKHFGFKVTISKTLPDNGVLVYHRRNKRALFNEDTKKINKLILVGCRGDLHDTIVPDFELLQNAYFADYERRFPMPHWPMPHIVPRDPTRGDSIKRIAFKGFSPQLHPDFRSQEWQDFLSSHGIEWVQNDVKFSHSGESQFDDSVWANYLDIDLVIAVRPERNEQHTNKPALKLYNAWHAGVPVILGHEYAYQEIGINGEDYIEVNNIEEAKKAILHLIENPDAYRSMIEKGKQKAHQYTHEAVFHAWKYFFESVLPEKIEKRKRQWGYKISRKFSLRTRYIVLSSWKWLTLQRVR